MNTGFLAAVKEKMQDEEFVQKLFANKTKEDIQAFLA